MSKKATIRPSCIFLGILIVLSTILGIFSIAIRLPQLLAEDDQIMAEFCLQLGLFCFLLDFIFIGMILYICLKHLKGSKTDVLVEKLTTGAPQFEQWFTQETESIKKRYKKAKIITMIGIIWMTYMEFQGILFFSGTIDIFFIVSLLFYIGFVYVMNWLSNYNKHYILPLIKSTLKNFPTISEREDFAEKMLRAEKKEIEYCASPKTFISKVYVLPDYCYIYELRKCRILKNRQVRKIVLEKETYHIGSSIFPRICYHLEAFTGFGDNEKSVFSAYFNTDKELYHALFLLQSTGFPDTEVQDMTNS